MRYYGPCILHNAFPLDDMTRFFYLFGENLIFKKRFGIATYFCFIFKIKNKIRKKNPPKGKIDLWKTKFEFGG